MRITTASVESKVAVAGSASMRLMLCSAVLYSAAAALCIAVDLRVKENDASPSAAAMLSSAGGWLDEKTKYREADTHANRSWK